jgi:Reverse transcriptase (RNA-dependent DNA polymerase)
MKSTGIVPKSWKRSTIVPIPKVPQPKSPQDMRPINMLPIYEKVLELCVHEQLSEYFEKNNLFYQNQFGFRKNRSCESALQLLLSKWRTAINNKKFVLTVMLDLKRAFETINRPMLIDKLKCYNIGGVVIKWLKSYLTGRSQIVKLEDELSDELQCNIGVPQGSVLGPLLFIIYMNEINKVVRFVDINLFADDTLVCIEGDNFEDAKQKLNQDLKSLTEWFSNNKLKLNASKSMLMLITSSKKKSVNLLSNHQNLKIELDGQELKFSECVKYLGVKVDYLLNFSEHIKYTASKIAKKIGYTSRINRFLTKWTKTIIYNTIVAPHYEYCSTLFLDANKKDLDVLQKLQNRAMRSILRCDWYTHSKDMLERLNWLSVKQKIEYKVLLFIHQVIKDKSNGIFNGMYKMNNEIHQHATRSATNFHMYNQINKSGQKSILCNGFKLYNKIPEDLKSMNLMKFKKEIRNYVKNKL